MKVISSQKISFVTVCHLIIFYVLCKANVATAIACYSCVSMNKSNPPCEDPVSAHITIQRPCRQTIPGHEGGMCNDILITSRSNQTLHLAYHINVTLNFEVLIRSEQI
ncbi:unnamed protein product [Schistosoma guineensis]|nr:unnamed protein product [Schistosoma guineensis]